MTHALCDPADVVDAIYAAGMEPARWPGTIARVADFVGAMGGMVAYSAPHGEESSLVVGRLREDLSQVYLANYARNAYSVALERAPPKTVLLASRLVPDDHVRRTAFHADILAPQKIEDQMVFVHPSLTGPGSSGGMSFVFNPTRMDSRADAVERLGRLVGHLSNAIDLSLQVGSPRRAQRQLLDALPGPAMLLDRELRIVAANPAADALLAAGDGLVVRRGDGLRLTAARSSDARALARVFARALSRVQGEASAWPTVRIGRLSNPAPLIVVVTPLPSLAPSFWTAVDRGARVLVRVVDDATPADRAALALGEAVGLTAAETRVAGLIGRGISVPEAAAALGVSAMTVRTHLNRCFDKTGLRSQAAFVRLVSRVPQPPEESGRG